MVKAGSLIYLRDYKNSLPYLDKALAINPHQIGAYFKAFALYFLGNYGASIYNYNKVLEITPNAKDALYGKKLAIEALFATARWR